MIGCILLSCWETGGDMSSCSCTNCDCASKSSSSNNVLGSVVAGLIGSLGGYLLARRFLNKQEVRNPNKLRKNARIQSKPAGSDKTDSDGRSLNGKTIDGISFKEIKLHEITNLSDTFESSGVTNEDVLKNTNYSYNKIVDNDIILSDIVHNINNIHAVEAFPRAGARAVCHFDPAHVKAAIVTCGGLCPGLNNVIREIVHTLTYLYGVEDILGIR